MRWPLAVVALLGVGLAFAIFFITIGAPTLLTLQRAPTPPEPIAFPHDVHVAQAGIDCAFCHRTASVGATAGYPEVQQCMFCHTAIAGESARAREEIKKVRDAWVDQRPIDWTRIHRMPDHVAFVHEAHIRAGFTCATCHGEVREVGQVTQVRSLNMGDCVGCHRQNNVSTQCATCHK